MGGLVVEARAAEAGAAEVMEVMAWAGGAYMAASVELLARPQVQGEVLMEAEVRVAVAAGPTVVEAQVAEGKKEAARELVHVEAGASERGTAVAKWEAAAAREGNPWEHAEARRVAVAMVAEAAVEGRWATAGKVAVAPVVVVMVEVEVEAAVEVACTGALAGKEECP